MKALIFLTIVTFLIGCGECKHYEYVETRKFEILEINPPKHFKVSLRDVESDIVFEDISVSKHCNSWRELYVGQIVYLEVGYYTTNNKYVAEILHIRECLCDQ